MIVSFGQELYSRCSLGVDFLGFGIDLGFTYKLNKQTVGLLEVC